ncbi:MAG: trans-acting enoyl reductase family protein [Haloarculaceae archaeon]
MTENLLVYGSYGYTGSLIVERAVEVGLSPTLAGRRAEPLEAQAEEWDLDHRVFSLQHSSVIERALADVDVVLNCAGPFSATAAPLTDACLATGTDYLDVAGEVDVLERAAERDAAAEDAETTVLPAVGFDVVPTDCLAASLHNRLQGATALTIALDGLGTFSPGTLQSIVADLGTGGAVRRGGRLQAVPVAWRTREFAFDGARKPAVTVPWGDVATAYYTTGIGDVEVYATVPRVAVPVLENAGPLAEVLSVAPINRAVRAGIEAVVSGPTAAERAASETRILGEVVDADGNRAVGRLRTPDTYDVTATAAVEAARRTLSGAVDPGFQTPASAFGADFVTELPGVKRTFEDVPAAAGAATADD